MMRIVFLSLIPIATIGVGKLLANAKKRRLEILAEQLAAMRVLRLRMLNSLEPMGILLRKSDSILFRALGNNLWEGDNLQESWYKLQQKEIKRGKMLDSLTNQDLELLNHFFENLGKSSRNEQCLLFSSIISQMEEAQAQAKRAYSESSRVYTALGALAGIGICILVV